MCRLFLVDPATLGFSSALKIKHVGMFCLKKKDAYGAVNTKLLASPTTPAYGSDWVIFS